MQHLNIATLSLRIRSDAMRLQGRIKPLISATYPLEKTAEALQELEARRVQGKIVVTMDAAARARL